MAGPPRQDPLGDSVVHTVRLLRRNVALTESYFLDLHHDTDSGNVVGILTPNRDGKAQSQILVDKNGKPQGSKTALLRVSNWTPGASTPKTTERSSSSTSRSTSGQEQ
jgi:alpha-ketoglutarate-dependent taurine dioxygenase